MRWVTRWIHGPCNEYLCLNERGEAKRREERALAAHWASPPLLLLLLRRLRLFSSILSSPSSLQAFSLLPLSPPPGSRPARRFSCAGQQTTPDCKSQHFRFFKVGWGTKQSSQVSFMLRFLCLSLIPSPSTVMLLGTHSQPHLYLLPYILFLYVLCLFIPSAWYWRERDPPVYPKYAPFVISTWVVFRLCKSWCKVPGALFVVIW
jgi:hypothetical protein